MPDWVSPLSAIVSAVLLIILIPVALKSASKHDLETHALADARMFEEIRGELSKLNHNMFTLLAMMRNGNKPPIP